MSGKIRLLNWQDVLLRELFFFEVQFQCPMVEASPSARAAATAPVLLPGISVKVSAEVLRLVLVGEEIQTCNPFFPQNMPRYAMLKDISPHEIPGIMNPFER